VSGGRRLCDVLHRSVLRAGVELRDPDQQGGENHADDATAEQFHLTASGTQGVVRDQPGGDKVKSDQRKHASNGQALVERGHHILHARGGFDEEAADDGGDDGHRAQAQGVEHSAQWGAGDQQGAENHGGNQSDCIGLEQVGRHTCAVAHVVAHVVRNHGRVAWIVFRDARFNFTHQVCTHIGAFGEDASAQAGKDGDQRGAEGKANQRIEQPCQSLVGRWVAADQKPVKTSDAQQTQAHHQHASYGATAEGDIERRTDATGGGLRGTHIGPDRDVHSNEAAGA